MSSELLRLSKEFSLLYENYKKIIRNADKNDPQERMLVENCIKLQRAEEELKNAIEKIHAAQHIVKNSMIYHREQQNILEERRIEVEQYRANLKWRNQRRLPQFQTSQQVVVVKH